MTTIKLLADHPWIKDFLELLALNEFLFKELYEFNPHTDPEMQKGLAITEPGSLNGLTDRYKASLMLKAQVQLLIRLQGKNMLTQLR